MRGPKGIVRLLFFHLEPGMNTTNADYFLQISLGYNQLRFPAFFMLSGILISIIIAIIEHFTKVCNKNDNSDVQLKKSHPDSGREFLEEFKKQASNLQLEQLQEILKCTQDQLQILIGKRPEKYIVKKKFSATGKP